MKRATRISDLPGLNVPINEMPPRWALNGSKHADPKTKRLRRRKRVITNHDIALAKSGLQEMHRHIEEAMRMDTRLEELQPSFKGAAMQKAWVVVVLCFLGSFGLLVSIFWSGWTAILIRGAIVGILAGLYFAPVHYFVFGKLREDAKLVRDLDKRSLEHARMAAKIGQTTNRRLRKKLGVKK